MAEFAPAFAKVIELEGGFTDHLDDPGGATNLGISLRFLQSEGEFEFGDIDNDGDLDYEDIQNMTMKAASDIYKKHWWDKYGYGSIPNQAVANKIFDIAVNMGAKQAHKLLQRAINCVLGKRLLVDDGILGEKSSHAMGVAIQQPLALLAALRAQQEGFYRVLVAKNDKFDAFLNGWLNRAVS